MTRVSPNTMMFATVSGCAQTAVVRLEKTKVEPAEKATAKSAARLAKTRSKTRQGKAKPA